MISRLALPEFKDQYHTENFRQGNYRSFSNKNYFFANNPRIPCEGYEIAIENGREVILLIGDSVTGGSGLAYEDIYWVKLQRLMDLYLNESPKIVVTSSKYGNTLLGTSEYVKGVVNTLINNGGNTVKSVIYQFNFNDITPYTRERIQTIGKEGVVRSKWFLKFTEFRVKVLNRSVFLRSLQHYLGQMLRRRSGSCEKQGIYALDQYTWTYGSKAFTKESEELWRDFERELVALKKVAESKGGRFIMLISPILYDIEPLLEYHIKPANNFDLSCSTINPRERLALISKKHNFRIIDPTSYIKDSFERRVKEKNFVYYFHPTDSNHPNEVTSSYIAEFMMGYFIRADWFQVDGEN